MSPFGDEPRRRAFGVGRWRWLLWPMSWRMPSRPSVQDRLAAVVKLHAMVPGQLPASDNMAP